MVNLNQINGKEYKISCSDSRRINLSALCACVRFTFRSWRPLVQKCLEVEDTIEEERKQTETKLETIESAVRMYELKAKNAQDHSKLKTNEIMSKYILFSKVASFRRQLKTHLFKQAFLI